MKGISTLLIRNGFLQSPSQFATLHSRSNTNSKSLFDLFYYIFLSLNQKINVNKKDPTHVLFSQFPQIQILSPSSFNGYIYLSLPSFSFASLSYQTLLSLISTHILSLSLSRKVLFLSVRSVLAMKHFMLPRNAILREANSTDPASSPSPSSAKPRSSRKSKSAKENAPPFDLTSITSESKPSPAMAAKLKSPLPPRPPPSSSHKRKLSFESGTENSASDSGVQVLLLPIVNPRVFLRNFESHFY